MKRHLFVLLVLSAFGLSFSSCATIVGGAKYNAHVEVPDHPDAKITVNGQYLGNGQVTASLNRIDCNQVNITVQDGNDEPQTTMFSGRKFRTGTLIADILAFFPGGLIIDAITGAWWRPDEGDSRITRQNVKNYLYTITYRPTTIKPFTSTPPLSLPDTQNPTSDTIVEPTVSPSSVAPSQPLTKTKAEALRELKQLLDEGVLTQEEYEKEKAKLLDSN